MLVCIGRCQENENAELLLGAIFGENLKITEVNTNIFQKFLSIISPKVSARSTYHGKIALLLYLHLLYFFRI